LLDKITINDVGPYTQDSGHELRTRGEGRSSSGGPPFLLMTPVRTAYRYAMNSPSTCRLAAGIGAFASDLRVPPKRP
jgi:hypothetical protein